MLQIRIKNQFVAQEQFYNFCFIACFVSAILKKLFAKYEIWGGSDPQKGG